MVDSREGVGVAGALSSLADVDVKVTGTVATTDGTHEVVPAGANGVVLNLTAIRATGDGFISVRPGGSTGTASTSSVNFEAGDVVANSVTVAMPTTGAHSGEISLRFDASGASGPTTHFAVDIVGYTTSAMLTALHAEQAATSSISRDATQDDGLFRTVWVRGFSAGGCSCLVVKRLQRDFLIGSGRRELRS